ncbi:hypothetical protein GF407_08105 [candidate division KSB1 bacterium]|nr:hypothetical protein [candidate division KSB1 bacterium]
MPSPIGHMLSGLAIVAAHKKGVLRGDRETLLVLVCVVLPDIDFIFGFIEGNPNAYHHQFTHSFFFAVAAGFLLGVVSMRSCRHFLRPALLFTFAIALHIVLDLFAVDKSAPYGAQIFWPFSDDYFIAPIQIFSDVVRSSDSATFIFSLFNRHNLGTIIIETVIMLLVILFIKRLERK